MVSGQLDPKWSDRLGGMRIAPLSKSPTDRPVTVLEGLITDQAQLSGILNTLSDQRLSLISVELMENNTNQQTNPG